LDEAKKADHCAFFLSAVLNNPSVLILHEATSWHGPYIENRKHKQKRNNDNHDHFRMIYDEALQRQKLYKQKTLSIPVQVGETSFEAI